jgi:hypothetical protein
VENSKKRRGIKNISSNSSPFFEMRLPCPPKILGYQTPSAVFLMAA